MAVAIRGPAGQPLPAGQVGRVWVSGPSLLTRYLGAAAHPVVEGWLDTGDVGFQDAGGELFLCGRARDLIVIRGRNHAPQDLERAADALPGIRTGCVVAVGHPTEDGERVCVFAEARDPRPTLADEVQAAVLAATGVDPHVVLVLAPGTLPRTSSGKLRRGEALRRWLDGTLTPPAPVTPWLLAGALARSALGYLRQ
jgi:acyl-CoA synthetase (AMP-forming)/AMP-acid ligase II